MRSESLNPAYEALDPVRMGLVVTEFQLSQHSFSSCTVSSGYDIYNFTNPSTRLSVIVIWSGPQPWLGYQLVAFP